MTRYSFAGRAGEYPPFVDYDINTDNPNLYYVLTYITNRRYWYALKREAINDEGMFDDGGLASKEEIAKMLETMPVSALPVEVFI